ncbi:MAG TPA: LysM peptidoglycan-binding domain-containing protein [Dehalococcoidia bacterium]|nr:LysM peptidoglycan-binding domain-containing protein [Dehalococcoidia bacterium]
MLKRLAGLALTALAAGLTAAACIFGGGENPISVQRPGSIPTATPPAKLPEPMLVGETQAGSSGTTSAVTGETTYVVRPGDSLFAIAAQFNIPPDQQAAWVAEVLRLNGIPDSTLLQAGVELRLPRVAATPRPTGTAAATRTAPAATAAPQTTATARPTVAGGGGTYTVVSGDNPTIIAQKLGIPPSQVAAWVEQLVALNGINPSALQVGQVLQLPPIPPTVTPTPPQ